jgi:hypothetical protein
LYFLSGKGVEVLVPHRISKHHTHPNPPLSESERLHRDIPHALCLHVPIHPRITLYFTIIGMNTVRYWPFFVIDWFAAMLWGSLFGVLGYLFGTAAMRVLDDFSACATEIFGGIFALVLSYVIARLLYRRRHRSG